MIAALAALVVFTGIFFAHHSLQRPSTRRAEFVEAWQRGYAANSEAPEPSDFAQGLVRAARAQTLESVTYDPAYVALAYPGGDVPRNRGVCADVVVRAYRAMGADLQVAVHEDMARAFPEYPQVWGLRQPDRNIDHRRVPNLMTLFHRHGLQLPTARVAQHFAPGNVVAWDLGNGRTHIGIVSDAWSPDRRRRLIIHNVGAGPREEDALFRWTVIGNFIFRPAVD